MQILWEAAKATLALGIKSIWDRVISKGARRARQRSRGPHYTLYTEFVQFVYGRWHNRPEIWRTVLGNVLHVYRQELPYDPTLPVVLLLKNVGQPVATMTVQMDDCDVVIDAERQTKNAHGIEYLAYKYAEKAHGQTKQFRLSFQSIDGYKDKHTYETVLGSRVLRRIDPA